MLPPVYNYKDFVYERICNNVEQYGFGLNEDTNLYETQKSVILIQLRLSFGDIFSIMNTIKNIIVDVNKTNTIE